MLLKACLLVIFCLMIIAINCKLFCDNPTLDSAFTADNETYLFRGIHFWLFNATNGRVSQQSNRINDTFKEPNTNNRLQTIDAVFWTPFLTEDKRINKTQKLLCIQKDKIVYYFQMSVCDNSTMKTMCFRIMTDEELDSMGITPDWNYWGYTLFDIWFPEKVEKDIIRVNKTLLIFHGSVVRYVDLEVFPPGTQLEYKPRGEDNDIPFDGSLKNVSKIDAIFEMPSTKDIVITSGLRYCRFDRNQLNIIPNITKSLNISCQWKQTKYLFGCEKSIEDIEDTTSATEDTEFSSDSTKTQTIDIEKNDNDFVVIVIIAVFSAIIIIIVGLIIGVAYCLAANPQKKYGISGPGVAKMASIYSLDSGSMVSVVTVDSTTGESPKSKNK